MSLGNIAKSHTPFKPSEAFKNSVFGLSDLKQENRINNFNLRNSAGLILGDKSRICKCGKVPTSSTVKIFKSKNGFAHFSGLQTCGSVWSCPVCSSKISERRRLEIQEAIDKWESDGNKVVLVTLTFPHSKDDNLKELLRKQSLASKKFKGRKSYSKRIRSDFEIKGTIRALETTYSDFNGWHPHLHELWFVKSKFSIFKMRRLVYSAWSSACVDSGLNLPSVANGVDIRAGDFAANYISKWGVSHEISKSHIKKGKKKNSKTPFQFLEDYQNGDTQAGYLFKEYSDAFKGKRQLFWSKGLKDFFGILVKSDDEILTEEVENSSEITTIHYFEWLIVVKYNAQAYLLILAELRGALAVNNFVEQLRLESIGFSPP